MGYQAIVTWKGKESDVYDSQKLEGVQESLCVSDASERSYWLVFAIVPRIVDVSSDKLQDLVNLFLLNRSG